MQGFVEEKKPSKIGFKIQIVILAAVLVLIALEVTALILDKYGKLPSFFFEGISRVSRKSAESEETLLEGKSLSAKETDSKEIDEETQKRIEELETKIKELEEKQRVPFPDGSGTPPLTSEQISAIVELWCPDDNVNYNGFVSIGSGTIASPEGIIITNRHVISNEDWSVIQSSPTCYVAITEDISEPPKMKYMADVVAYAPAPPNYPYTDDFDFDIAILYIFDICYECEDAPASLPASFPYIELGYSDILQPGDYVAIAGYPEIGAGTFNFTEGIISGRVGEFVLKTDAKIDSGNSGGAVLNNQNMLVGVPTWTITGQAESIGYIIGIDPIFNWYDEKVVPSEFIEVPY